MASTHEDTAFMAEALRLAQKAQGRTLPNPLVGAVLVQWTDTMPRIVGEGVHPEPGAPHAEIFALNEAGDLARGATCYVNLEPCAHSGRTGPCVDALIQAGIAEVVYGIADPNPRVQGRGLKRLKDAGIVVRGPVLADACSLLNAPFLHAQRTKSAWLTLKLALTLDGYLADPDGNSSWITGPAARARVHRLRACHQAVMVGAQTVRDDNPRLTPRDRGDVGREHVIRVIPTGGNLDLEGTRLMDEVQSHPVWLYTTEVGSQSDPMKWAVDQGAQVMILDGPSERQIHLHALLQDLFQREVFNIFCEGGAQLASRLFADSMVNRVHLFRAPRLLGAGGGKPGVGDLGIRVIERSLSLRRVEVLQWPPDTEEVFELSSKEEA